jgi:membrane protein YdbS with pleckstrin-like domain
MSIDEQTGVRLQDGEEVLLAVKPKPFNGLMVFTLGLYYPWWQATWFVVTNRRLVTMQGILNKTEVSLPLHFVQDASVRTSWQGVGRVDVSTAGGGDGISRIIGLKPQDARQLADTIMSQTTKPPLDEAR